MKLGLEAEALRKGSGLQSKIQGLYPRVQVPNNKVLVVLVIVIVVQVFGKNRIIRYLDP